MISYNNTVNYFLKYNLEALRKEYKLETIQICICTKKIIFILFNELI